MDLAFTEEQLAIRDAVREALEGECAPSVVRAAWKEPQPQLWSLLGELGVWGTALPEEAGGLGLGMLDLVLVLEELGRAAFPGPSIEVVAAAPALFEAGEDDLVARVALGRALVSVVAPDGHAVDADRCEAVLSVQEGGVRWIEDPDLSARSSVDGSRRLFAVSGQGRLLSCSRQALLDRASLAVAAQTLGAGRKVLDLAVAYAKDRHQFGKPIGSFQAVQHQLADALLRLSFAAPLVYRAAWSLDHRSAHTPVDVAMAHSAALDAADLACRKALQVHGAIGYAFECDLHLWMKRVWALRAAWGGPAVHRERVAASLFGGTDV
jgi:alkylation response protein AidB-like acyl-CoA dehydrogenase